MKYIGNFKDWIPNGLIDMILAEEGFIIPVYQPKKWVDNPERERALAELEKAGYPKLNYSFHQYIKETPCVAKYLSDTNHNWVNPINPIGFDTGHWWIVKYKPGDMQPMHFDPHIVDMKRCLRYTMMLTDFEEGHILTYNDFLLRDYTVGDLYEWPDSMIMHGAANIGVNPRISLQFSFYDL